MSPSTAVRRLFLIASAAVLLSTTASAFNLTILLSRYPGFEQFNSLLSRTMLAPEINRLSTVTVLGLPNDRFNTLAQMTEEDQRRILSLHILLDYFDMPKLNKIPPATKAGPIATLFQSSGVAGDMQGFVDIIHRRDGSISFGSSVQGAPFVSNLVAAVAASPYNISLLSVSQPIIAPGMEGFWGGDTVVAQPPPVVEAPPPAEKPSPPPAAEEPVADEPTAEASVPSPAPSPAPAPAPADDESEEETPADDTPAMTMNTKSAAAREVVSGAMLGLVIGLASLVSVQ